METTEEETIDITVVDCSSERIFPQELISRLVALSVEKHTLSLFL
jgi:hypothetical protein